MLTVVVPCAGVGKRFKEAGYACPKPLIDVRGVAMIAYVIDPVVSGLGLANVPYNLVFVVAEGEEGDAIASVVIGLYPGTIVLRTPPTDGAAKTVLVAEELFRDTSLLIVNCDQIVSLESVAALTQTGADGTILTMPGDGTKKWSYVRLDPEDGLISEVVEKEPISDRATCGLYYVEDGEDFIRGARNMIGSDDRVNGEFYVAPVFNWLLFDLATIKEVRIEDHGNVFHGLGTPEDLGVYLNSLGEK